MLLHSRLYDEDATSGITSDESTSSTDSAEVTSSGAPDSTPPESALDALAGADSPDASAATAPAPSSLFDTLRTKHGVDLSQKYKSEDELLKGLINAQRLVGQRDQFSDLGRYYAEHYEPFQQYLKSQQQGQPQYQQQAQPQQQANEWWNPPQWSETWNKFLDPETRQPREDAPLNVKQAFYEREDYISKWQQQLVFSPDKALEPLFERWSARVRQDVEARYRQESEVQARNAEAGTIVDQNASWIFQTGVDGQILTDEQGRRLFTQAGAMMLEELPKLHALKDQNFAFKLAKLAVQERLGGSVPSAPSAPAPARHKPNTNGTPNRRKPATSDDTGLSLRERLMRDAEGLAEAQFAS